MNYVKSLALAVLALAAMNMSAANVDVNAAKAKALQFMMTQPMGKFMSPTAQLQLIHTEASSVNAKLSDFYVFNLSDGSGFIIMSAEDRTEEVLAIGDRAIRDYNNLPENMMWFLGHYKEQIEFLQKNPKLEVTLDSEILKGSLKAMTVAPLLGNIEWDQEAPYWNQTPTYRNQHTLTGCVATAMAQVMMYWKYPASLPALASYTTYTQRISVPALPGTTLDWDNMLDQYYGVNYSTAQATAVATLMRYCGQSCWMDYDISSNGGSGAYCEDQLTGMKTFGYNSNASDLMRDDYSTSTWNSMMQSDLAAGRPILYAGDDTRGGGHAFVVDGYDNSTNKYHLNWGWSGDGNCYCAMDAFNVSGYKFNSYMEMLYEVYPEGSAIEKYAPVVGNATSVGTTSFTAHWTDQTPAENVVDYTLYVNAVGSVESLLTETFAGVDVSSDGSADVSASLNDYCDNQGWTGYAVYLAPGGVKIGSGTKTGYITSPAVDLSSSEGTVTVKFNAKYYGTDNASVIVACGDAQQTVALTSSAADYTVVLEGCDAEAGQNITLCCTGSRKRVYIYNVEILSGNASSMLAAHETGDANSRVITGITSKSYTVTGLTPGQSYKYYVVANYTDNTNKASEKAVVTLEGVAPAEPEMIVDPETLSMNTVVGTPVTATFSVLGADLTGAVNVTLNDNSGAFSVNPATISIADAENGADVTVTYNPAAAGTHNATVTLSSQGCENLTVTLTGTAEAPFITVAPVMQNPNASYVTTSSFRADWTDETPAANVASYTLYVNKKGQAGNALFTETFAGVDVATDGTADRGASMDDYCDNAGWTGYAAYEAATGGFKLGSSTKLGYITTPAIDMIATAGTIAVKVNADYFGTDASSLVVSCGEASETIELTNEATDYVVTLTGIDVTEAQQVTLSCTAGRKRVYVHNVAIFGGAAAAKAASETGDADNRVITGITNKYYVVENLTSGATYEYKVKALYTNGTESEMSNAKEVTLEQEVLVPEMIVEPETLTMDTEVGVPVTATFDMLAANLTGNVTVTLADESGMFAVSPATISIADAEEGATVTVTYTPTAAGSHSATVTLSSEGAEDVTVTVNGSATLTKGALVLLPANEEYVTSSSFRADWTDETPAANVASYTLFVNKKAEAGDILLTETFAGVDVAVDGTADRGNSMDDYCDNAGWTGYAAYEAATGGFKLGSNTKTGYIQTPALDMSASNGTIMVKVNANYYGTDGNKMAVSCGEVTDTIEIAAEAADYIVTLTGIDVTEAQNVTISCVGNKKRVYVHGVTVMNGASALTVSETGDADSRIITGITDKYYVVENLTEGATYEYKVKAVYVDESESEWSNIGEVTLLEGGHGFVPGDVNHDGSVSPSDVSALIDYLLNGNDEACPICADVDCDGSVSPADISALIDSLLGH